MQFGCDSLKPKIHLQSLLLSWQLFALVFCYYFCCLGEFFCLFLLLFCFIIVVFFFVVVFLHYSSLCLFFFFTPNRFRFPNLDKTTAEYRRNSNPTPAEVNGGTIPTTTQNVPNKLYIRTSTFRFSSQLPGSPTVAAVGLSGYISMLQWTSQGPRDVPNPCTCIIKCNDKFSLAGGGG